MCQSFSDLAIVAAYVEAHVCTHGRPALCRNVALCWMHYQRAHNNVEMQYAHRNLAKAFEGAIRIRLAGATYNHQPYRRQNAAANQRETNAAANQTEAMDCAAEYIG